MKKKQKNLMVLSLLYQTNYYCAVKYIGKMISEQCITAQILFLCSETPNENESAKINLFPRLKTFL